MEYQLKIPGCAVTSVQHTPHGVHISVESQSSFGYCPSCGAKTQRIHSYYERQLVDLPLDELGVQLRVRVKRFRCQQDACDRLTFVEVIPQLTERYSRLTKCLAVIMWHIGQVVGGRPGSRLAHKLQITLSHYSILRLLRCIHTTITKPVRILGVDDWAKKRGQTYGTILVDLEDHRVVDLLPDRDAETVANWLRLHPTVEIVTRDRSTEYANGITSGAPQAIQVADRWHLLKNLTEMVQRALRDEWTQVHTSKSVSAAQNMPLPRASGDETQKQLHREQRQKQYARVQYLKHKGYSQRRIARLLNLSRGTVRAFYNATEFPKRKPVSRFSKLDPFLDCLNAQMKTREATARQLWQEIAEQEYIGSYGQVSKWVTGFNKQQGRKMDEFPTGRLPGQDICLRLLTRQPETLTNDDAYLLCVLLEIPVL